MDGTCSKTIAWDAFGYYAYLPITFLDYDIKAKDFSVMQSLNKEYNFCPVLYQFNYHENGNQVIRYSNGVAMVSLPFFICGHLSAMLANYPLNGFSLPYEYWFTISNLFWLIVGLIAFNKLLQSYFSISTTNIVLLLILVGTNFIETTIKSFGNTHLFEFTFYALLLLQTIKYYKNNNVLNSLLLGLLIGIVTIIRPINILCVFIVFLWELGVINKETLIGKIKFFIANRKSTIYLAIGVFVAVLPQIIYWKIVTNSFLYQGYDNPAEGLDILNPHTINFLFSFRKGWFTYTPIMLFAMVGFYIMHQQKVKNTNALMVFSIINIFLLSTWTCWWYAASYGQRTMVDTYALLAIPLGFFIENVKSKSVKKQFLFASLAIALLAINIFRMWQFDNYIINYDRETKQHFLATLFATNIDNSKDSMLLIPRNSETEGTILKPNNYTHKTIYTNNFEKGDEYFELKFIKSEPPKNYFSIDSKTEYSKAIGFEYSVITNKTHAYTKVSFDAFFTKNYEQHQFGLAQMYNHSGRSYYYHCSNLIAQNGYDTTSNKWNSYQFTLLSPAVRSNKDKFAIYFWNNGFNNIKISNLKVEAYEPIYDPE